MIRPQSVQQRKHNEMLSNLKKNDKTLVLSNGNIQKLEKDGGISVIKFETTALNLSGLSTKTTPVPKIQETPTLEIIQCVIKENIYLRNCKQTEESYKENVIEFNKRNFDKFR